MGWVRFRDSSFRSASRFSRVAIVLAGPLFSIFGGLLIATLPALADASWGFQYMQVDAIRRGSIAERAGFQVGDTLIAVEDEQISDWQQVPWKVGQKLSGHLDYVVDNERKPVKDSDGEWAQEWRPPSQSLVLHVEREGHPCSINLTPYLVELRELFPSPRERDSGGAWVDLRKLGLLPVGPIERAEWFRISERPLGETLAWRWARITNVWAPSSFFYWVSPQSEIPHLGSPSMSSGVIGPLTCLAFALETGPLFFLRALGYLSVALGVANLLPILPLDGGAFFRELIKRPVVSALETTAKEDSPMNLAETVITLIGLLFIVMLTLLALWADLRLLTQWIWW
jgi:membrane-associated protease RseP (regulator of RpoE activity)